MAPNPSSSHFVLKLEGEVGGCSFSRICHSCEWQPYRIKNVHSFEGGSDTCCLYCVHSSSSVLGALTRACGYCVHSSWGEVKALTRTPVLCVFLPCLPFLLLSPAVWLLCFAQVGCLPSWLGAPRPLLPPALLIVSHFRASLVLPVA